MDLWNACNLKPPNDDFCAYNVSDAKKLGNVANLVEVLSSAAKEFGPDNILWAEVKLFQAIKKRLALSQRSDKFMKAMQQVDHCIRNLVHMNMAKVFQDLARNFMRNAEHSVIYLPSRQQLEYVLIRCQGAAKLLCCCQNYIFSTFSYLVQTLCIGHTLQKLLMACAVISRINTLLKYLLHITCNSYRELAPWLHKLNEGDWKWEQSLSLPEDLWTWLEPEDLKLLYSSKSSSVLPFLGKMFSSETNEMEPKPLRCEEQPPDEMQEDMDLGEVVSCAVVDEATSPSVKHPELKKKIQAAETVKSLRLLWKEIFLEQKPELVHDLPHVPHLKEKKKIKNLIIQLKNRVAVAKQKSKVKMLVKQAGITFMSYLGIQDGEDECIVDNNTADRSITCTGVSIPSGNTKPVRTLKKLRELHQFLCSNPFVKNNSNLVKHLTELFEENAENAKLLKQAGDIKLSHKLLLRTSKKMISICNDAKIMNNKNS